MDKKIFEKYLEPKLNITIFDELDSTNNYLKKLGSQGEKENQLVIAESQTCGRGRMGRSFYSPNGTGIYFSLLLHPKISAEKSLFLTVMAAVSVAETVMKYNKNDVKIKWVNDIYIDGKKVCGILTEGAINSDKMLDYAVVGIGINVVEPENGFPDVIKDIATAIFPGNAEDNINEKIVAEVVNRFFSAGPQEMAAFWQYLHFNVQPPKKTAPLPPLPARAGSSHLWSMALATSAVSGQPQKPVFPAVRSAPHILGHSSQFR